TVPTALNDSICNHSLARMLIDIQQPRRLLFCTLVSMPYEQSPQPNPIAQLNDAFRRSGQGIFLTQGVQTLPDVPGLITAVQEFDQFTPDNDPYGEHDFG